MAEIHKSPDVARQAARREQVAEFHRRNTVWCSAAEAHANDIARSAIAKAEGETL